MQITSRPPADGSVARTVAAVQISAAVLPLLQLGTSGEVVSVHRRAATVRLAGRSVALVPGAGGGLPNGIGLLGEPELAVLGLRPGMTVAVGYGCLTLSGDRLRIDLSGAPTWSPRLERIVPRSRGLELRLALARSEAAGAGPHGLSRGTAFGDAARRPLELLEAGLRAGDDAAVEAAGGRLIGLGGGLTPSGDDLLVGLTAGLTAGGHPAARRLARAWAWVASDRTTPVAATFHLHAAQAEYAERLHDVLRAVLAGPADGVAPAVARAAAWGATSGRDVLAGLLLGLEPALAAKQEAA